MAHLYALNTARKLRFIATLFSRGSKRILGLVDSSPANTFRKVNTASMFDITLQTNPIASGPIQDAVYYKHSDAGYCVFQVENTLFKVILSFYSYSGSQLTFKAPSSPSY